MWKLLTLGGIICEPIEYFCHLLNTISECYLLKCNLICNSRRFKIRYSSV